MLLWLGQLIGCIITNIVCYLTNPIAVLFADVKGECPHEGFWSFWELWWTDDNNSLDVAWMIDEDIVPKIFQYDYHKHYEYHYEDKSTGNTIPGYVDVLDANFTLKERIQRYFCRLCWLYRNNAYGFAGLFFSVSYKPVDTLIRDRQNEKYSDQFENILLNGYVNEGKKRWLNEKWCYRLEWVYCSRFYLRIYLGWKLTFVADDPETTYTSHIAAYIWPFRQIPK